MATMQVLLPDEMRAWVENQAESGRYSNISDYVCDLIRKDQDKALKIKEMQALVAEGFASGEGERTMNVLLLEEVRARYDAI